MKNQRGIMTACYSRWRVYFELRKNPRILSLIRDFDKAGKIIGAIAARSPFA